MTANLTEQQPYDPSSQSIPRITRRRSDAPFFFVMSGLSSCFILLIVLLLAAGILTMSFGYTFIFNIFLIS